MKKLLLSLFILSIPLQSSAASSVQIAQKIKDKKFDSVVKSSLGVVLIPLSFYVSWKYLFHYALPNMHQDSQSYLTLIPGYPQRQSLQWYSLWG